MHALIALTSTQSKYRRFEFKRLKGVKIERIFHLVMVK